MKLLDFFRKKDRNDPAEDKETDQCPHAWQNGVCSLCGEVCEHPSTHSISYDCGEQDYCSYGGGVENLVIHAEKCDRCGCAFSGYATGDFCGTDEELQNMIDELIRNENR